DVGPDGVDRSFALDRRQQVAITGVLAKRRGLPLVHVQPMAHGRLAVILTLIELAPAPIADSWAPWRSGHKVERRLTLTAQPSSGEPAHELGLADVEGDHPVELLTELLQQTIQGLGLGNRPRKAVEDEPARGVGLAQALGEGADPQVV